MLRWQIGIIRKPHAIVNVAKHINPIAGRCFKPERQNVFGADVFEVIEAREVIQNHAVRVSYRIV